MKFRLVFLFLCFHCNNMKADSNSDLLHQALSLSYVGEGYIFKPPTECSLLLDIFADYASNLTKCAIKHARPIRLCEKCVGHYVNFDGKYKELMTTVVNGTSCKSIFISHDRLDAVLEYHNSILAVWDKGHCNACFDWNVTTPELSNGTKNFNKMFNETMECILQNINPVGNNSEEVCDKCMLTYLRLDEYYKSLSIDSIGVDSICMDVVDSMNATRSIWSKSLNCCQLRRSPEIIFLACSGIISALPLLFYIAVRYCGPIRDLPNVLKQSRFKQRLLRMGRGRIH